MLEKMKKCESTRDFLEKFPLLRQAGIKTYTTWMVGLPGETQADRDSNRHLMQQLQPDSCDQFVYIGIPKSEIYEQLDQTGQYQYKEPSGILYPMGYLELAEETYGPEDPRCRYVRRLYQQQAIKISPLHLPAKSKTSALSTLAGTC